MSGIKGAKKTNRYLDECKVKAVLLASKSNKFAGALLSASYLEC